MPSRSLDDAGDRRELRLRLEEAAALTTTTLTFSQPRRSLELRTAFGDVAVTSEGVGAHSLEEGVVRLLDVRAGAVVVVRGRVAYGTAPYGLCRWTDPADGRDYVVGSGSLGGAAHFLAAGEGPADRMATTVVVDSAGIVRTFSPGDTAATASAASHHLGLVAGDWRVATAPGLELLARRSLDCPALIDRLMADTRTAVDWLLNWFGVPDGGAPWGRTYTQVLLPQAPWAAMEHPGCVLVSELLLRAERARRVAVLAHEAAHQWFGNLISPLSWPDVGIFEGLAELLGQLACEAVLGQEADSYLRLRRSAGPLAHPPAGPDLRALAITAGLAEVAGPVQHAELLRAARTEIGAAAFRERIVDLVRRRTGATCGSDEVWEALGCPARRPRRLPLPQPGDAVVPARLPGIDGLALRDPTTAAERARQAFRGCAPGPQRVAAALAAIADPELPRPVVAGLAAELAGKNTYKSPPMV